jgi:hypothetical protein
LLVSWVVVLFTHPSATTSISQIAARASVGAIPGPLIITAMMILYGGLVVLGLSSYWASHRAKSLPAGHPGRMRATHLEEA